MPKRSSCAAAELSAVFGYRDRHGVGDESAVLRCCTYIRDRIRSELRGRKDAAVLGPAPLPGRARQQPLPLPCNAHCRFDKEIRTLVSGLLIQCNTAKEYKGVSVFADYNPME